MMYVILQKKIYHIIFLYSGGGGGGGGIHGWILDVSILVGLYTYERSFTVYYKIHQFLICNVFKNIRNYLVTYQITKMFANIFEHVQNESTLLANIFMHHQHVVEMRKRHNIVGQHGWHGLLPP